MTDNFTEAPASLNFYVVTHKGYNLQITLRDTDENKLLERFAKLTAKLEEYKAQPKPVGQQPTTTPADFAPPKQASTPPPTLDGGQPDPAWCPIHQCEMKRRQNDKGVWYSHKVGDSYCNGKA